MSLLSWLPNSWRFVNILLLKIVPVECIDTWKQISEDDLDEECCKLGDVRGGNDNNSTHVLNHLKVDMGMR